MPEVLKEVVIEVHPHLGRRISKKKLSANDCRSKVKVGSKLVTSCLDAQVLMLTTIENIPSVDEFHKVWALLEGNTEYRFAKAAIEANTILDLTYEAMVATCAKSVRMLADPNMMRVVYIGKVLRLDTLQQQQLLIEAVISASAVRQKYLAAVDDLLKTDKHHLQDLAKQITVDGDGKRGVLKEVIAYGMQAKRVEDEVLDAEGDVITPAVYSLADPKMALSAVQELNRMDHEYGEDDKASSSIESQAQRVLRLRKKMESASRNQAHRLQGVAKQISKAELEEGIPDDRA